MSDSTPHLRARDGGGPQPTTSVELFFDLVFVFAITQLSHLILADLSLASAGRAGFLLLVVWWAWIYTTWMVNWFDPASARVRATLMGVMMASLLMSASLPTAFSSHAFLFAGSYVGLQVGRNLAGVVLVSRPHTLRELFERLLAWSTVAGALWLAGAALHGDSRLLLWGPALILELIAPQAGYWMPGRGASRNVEYEVEGAHFAERCQGFIIIALGESIVVTGASAAARGLTATVVLCLAIAFIEAAALWWLYFGAAAEHSKVSMSLRDDAHALARDAYTYLHLPIVAGIIMSAVGDELLIAEPHASLHGVGLAMVVGGPALYLLGENCFRFRMTATTNAKRFGAAALLVALALAGPYMSCLALSAVVAALLATLSMWEALRPGETPPLPVAVASHEPVRSGP
ncbi:MAG: low temperature requirement protein [Conexibacter sp.]|nr:low temperature requirement protein [Conexibacter sp.]